MRNNSNIILSYLSFLILVWKLSSVHTANVTTRSQSVDNWLFSENLFPGHEIPRNIKHSDALKMFSTLLEDRNILSEAYAKYRAQHEKEEDEVRIEHRLANFKENLHYIFRHNLKADAGHFQFQLGVNQFADMSTDEMKQFLGANDKLSPYPGQGPINPSPQHPPGVLTTSATPLPPSFDLREGGFISPVKNQKQCGSCVFFSMAGLMEGLHAVKYDGDIINVSEQNMLDCATRENGYVNNAGCNGNIMEDSLQFLVDHGVTAEHEYEYVAKQLNCSKEGKEVISQLKDWWVVDNSVDVFKATLALEQKPIAAAFLVYLPFMFYRTGIYDSCAPPDGWIGGHAVLIMGYGQFFDTGYWMVKNSWSTKWGEMGYFRYVSGSRHCLMERWGFTGNLV